MIGLLKMAAAHVSALLPNETAREVGQGVVEYALVLGVIVVALFLAFTYTGVADALGTALTSLTDCFTDGPNCALDSGETTES